MHLDATDLERALRLKQAPLFHRLPLDVLAGLARTARTRAYRPGERLGTDGEFAASCHLIEAGTLSLSCRGEARTLSAPALFNEPALVGRIVPRIEGVAIDETRLLSVHRSLFQELCSDHPEVLMELSRQLADRLHACSEV